MKNVIDFKILAFLNNPNVNAEMIDNAFEAQGAEKSQGIGPELASQIVAKRPFDNMEELQKKVSGIGEARVEFMRKATAEGALDSSFTRSDIMREAPDWVTVAQKMGLNTHPTAFGNIVDLNSDPELAQQFLEEVAEDQTETFFTDEIGQELISFAQDLRQHLSERGINLLPIEERSNRDARNSESLISTAAASLYEQFANNPDVQRNKLSKEETLLGFNKMNGITAIQAQASNSMYLSKVLFAPNGERSYVLFLPAGPIVYYNSTQNGSFNFDEADVEMIEIGIELLGIVLGLLSLLIGGGLFTGKVTKDGLRQVVLKILANPKAKAALIALISFLLGLNADKIKKGDKDEMSKALKKILDFIRTLWKEGLIKELLALLGVQAVVIGTIIFFLWYFGVGELISLILAAAGLTALIQDFVTFMLKMTDNVERKKAKPVTPGTGKAK